MGASMAPAPVHWSPSRPPTAMVVDEELSVSRADLLRETETTDALSLQLSDALSQLMMLQQIPTDIATLIADLLETAAARSANSAALLVLWALLHASCRQIRWPQLLQRLALTLQSSRSR